MSDSSPPLVFDPFAAVLAWLVPGLGHIVIGQKERGLVILVAVHLMMATGLLVGGIDVVDKNEDRWWYMGEALAGPIPVLINKYHQKLKVEVRDPVTRRVVRKAPPPGDNPAYEPSLARVNEMGTLFVTLAGMLNLICIIDVVQHPPRNKRAADRADDKSARQDNLVGSVEARER